MPSSRSLPPDADAPSAAAPRPSSRRRFLRRVGLGAVAAVGLGYPLLEARLCRVLPVTLPVPGLPPEFEGLTAAFLADVHHGPWVALDYVRGLVERANALRPDLVLLGGDYVSDHARYIAPAIEALGRLRAPLGRFAVLGNHDHWEGAEASRAALADAGLADLTNRGLWVERRGARLRLGGVGDLWEDRQDLDAALGDAGPGDASVILSHNPDFAELIRDPRVGLVLSGHTHGGQVHIPGYGAPWTPSRYGAKYLSGLVEAPACRVFVTRGAGTTGPPARLFSPPEIVHITFTAGPALTPSTSSGPAA